MVTEYEVNDKKEHSGSPRRVAMGRSYTGVVGSVTEYGQ